MNIVDGIILAMGMASGSDTSLHSNPRPEHTIVVYVISNDCRATCGCTIRLDITKNQKLEKGIYRVNDTCDVEIK